MNGIRKNQKLKAGLQLKDMNMTDDEVFDEVAGYTSLGTGFGEYAEKLIIRIAQKVGIPEDQWVEFGQNWHKFAKESQCIESDCNYEVGKLMGNKDSSAKGGSQFLTTDYGPEDKEIRYNPKTGKDEIFIPKNPVEVAKNRAYASNVDDEFVKGISKNPNDWTEDQADVMFISNIYKQDKQDTYMVDVGKGNMYKETYSKFHHTNVDKETRERMDKQFYKEK